MPKIFVNMGHAPNGVPDCGAVGKYSTESEVVASIGKVVADCLSKVGYEVKTLQSDSLYEICNTSDQWDADLFVSIHCNAFNHVAKGIETFHYNGSANGSKLAHTIHKQLTSTFPDRVDRGVKTANYYVLRNTDAPAVLIETEFIDNPECEMFLNKHITEIGMAIARGISDFYA